MVCTDITPIIRALAGIYTLEEIDVWLDSPQPLMMGKVPSKEIAEGRFESVLNLAQQIADGVYI